MELSKRLVCQVLQAACKVAGASLAAPSPDGDESGSVVSSWISWMAWRHSQVVQDKCKSNKAN